MQHIKRRLITAVMILALLPLQMAGASAATEQSTDPGTNVNGILQPIALSLKDACDRAQNNTYSIKKIDKSIEKLWKQEDKDMSASNSVQQQLDELDEYRRLYKKQKNGEVLSEDEKTWLQNDMMMFGETPPDFSSDQMYEQFIKTRDLPHYDVWAQIQNEKRSREVEKLKIEDSVRRLYYNLYYLKDLQNSNALSLATMEKEYKDLLEKYKRGLVSEIDRYQCEIKLSQKRLETRKQERDLKNTEMQLKTKCGIPASQEIKLEAVGLNSDVKLLTYKEYCDKALKNRNEVLTDKLNFEVLTRKLDITKQYKIDSLSIDRMDIQQQADNARFSLNQSTADVLEDIQWAYADITLKQAQMLTAKKAADNSRAKQTIAQKQYELGQVNILAVWTAKDTANADEISYRKAQQDFDYAYYKINLATGVGPGYK